MDSIIFQIGNLGVTALEALLLLATISALALVFVIILVLRSNNHKTEEAAKIATDALRSNFNQQIAERDNRLRAMQQELEKLRAQNGSLQSQSARMDAQMVEREKQNAENLKRLENARAQMTDEFKSIAADIMKVQGETFSKQNREQVDTLLTPLREKITEFQRETVQGRTQLSEQLKHLAQDSLQMRAEAQNLTRALKGSSQMQGAWGEMILTSVLDRSGLVENEHYFVQQSHGVETGGRVRTDVEIMMPNEDRMIVDSKVSLTAFEAMTNAENDEIRAQQLAAHVASIRSHITTLSSKNYQSHSGSGFDFVIMFVPMEAAFSVALGADPGLIDFAFSRNVSISTPTTLLSALRTVRNVWDIEKRHRNAEEIAERAGKLFDKVVGFLGSMDKLEKNLDNANKSFSDAKGQLSQGAGNVVRQVQMLQELGAKTSKNVDAGWLSDDEVAPTVTRENQGLPKPDETH